MEDNKQLLVTSSPHMRTDNTVKKDMRNVIIALIPTGLVGIYVFGMRALLLILVSICTCVLSEYLSNKAMKREQTIGDLSAVVTGLLLAYNVPVTLEVWKLVIGAFFAIVVCKELFGGLGQNIVNPALGARAFLLASWSQSMSSFPNPGSLEAMTGATPLSGRPAPKLLDMFLGKMPGCIGEVSTCAILIGGLYLIFMKVIDYKVPLTFICTTAVFLAIYNKGFDGLLTQLLSGGLMLGAFFMATDYVTTPVTSKGRVIFALGCGFLTATIRKFGGYPEGVSYSILIMNLFVPMIEKATMPKIFGLAEEKEAK